MNDLYQAPSWHQFSADEVYYLAHLENEARDAATSLAIPDLISGRSGLQSLHTAQEALLAHSDSRSASWLADKAITGAETQQQEIANKRARLIADISAANLVVRQGFDQLNAGELVEYIDRNFDPEKSIDEGAAFELWKAPSIRGDKITLGDIHDAIRKAGLIPVGIREAMRFAAHSPLGENPILIPVSSQKVEDTWYSRRPTPRNRMKRIPGLESKNGRQLHFYGIGLDGYSDRVCFQKNGDMYAGSGYIPDPWNQPFLVARPPEHIQPVKLSDKSAS